MWYSETLGLVKTPRAITLNGMQHSSSIFRLWSKEELAAIGITPATVKTPDRRYYETGVKTQSEVNGETIFDYAGIEKNVDDLKKVLISDIKDVAGSFLSPSDWRVLREMDGGTALSSDWKTYRNEIRAHGNSLEQGIEAFASVEAVKNFQNHEITEVRYVQVADENGIASPGTDTYESKRLVDKTRWGWPVAPDAIADPYHVEYK